MSRPSTGSCRVRHFAQFGDPVLQRPQANPQHLGSALAIAPDEGWALLASNAWVTLGTTLPQTPPFDPADVAIRAETWLQARSS